MNVCEHNIMIKVYLCAHVTRMKKSLKCLIIECCLKCTKMQYIESLLKNCISILNVSDTTQSILTHLLRGNKDLCHCDRDCYCLDCSGLHRL